MISLLKLRAFMRPTLYSNVRLLSDKNKTPSTPTINDEDEIKLIQENEEQYFQNVKNSFENLKKQRDKETLEEKRSRLLYQSRKRGILENGLLLGNFCAKHLGKMNESQLNEYDSIINGLYNEWDLYYWMTNGKEVPKELQSNEILKLMKAFCSNESKETRTIQPGL